MLGTVRTLRRYPVKSMLGEDIAAADVTGAGLAGDRGLALIHQTTGRVVSAKNPRLWRAMLTLAATLNGESVKITFPDGKISWSTDADVDDVLSEFLGQPVTLTATPPEGAAMEHADPDMVNERGLTADAETTLIEVSAGAPDGTFFNFAPLHLITTATLDQVGELHPARDGGPVSLLRYRPNVVISTPDQRGFTENDWLDHELAIGGDLVVRVVARTPRCAVPTLPHGATVDRDPEALRIVARHNRVAPRAGSAGTEPCAGVYAEVVRPGVIGTGDAVRMALAPAEPPVQGSHLLGQLGHRPCHRDGHASPGNPLPRDSAVVRRLSR
jgi:MOSC domain-containing protein